MKHWYWRWFPSFHEANHAEHHLTIQRHRHRMTLLHAIYNSFPFVVLPQHLFCRNPNRPSIWVNFFIVTSRDRFLPQQKVTYIGDSSPNKWHISPIRLLETWSNWFRSMKASEGNQQKDQGMFFFVFFCLQDSLEHWSFSVGFSTTTLVGLYVSGPGRFRVGIQGGNPTRSWEKNVMAAQPRA